MGSHCLKNTCIQQIFMGKKKKNKKPSMVKEHGKHEVSSTVFKFLIFVPLCIVVSLAGIFLF